MNWTHCARHKMNTESVKPTLSAKCWMMKARLDMRGFSNREHVFRWVLYSFWAQESSDPLGICNGEGQDVLSDYYSTIILICWVKTIRKKTCGTHPLSAWKYTLNVQNIVLSSQFWALYSLCCLKLMNHFLNHLRLFINIPPLVIRFIKGNQ